MALQRCCWRGGWVVLVATFVLVRYRIEWFAIFSTQPWAQCGFKIASREEVSRILTDGVPELDQVPTPFSGFLEEYIERGVPAVIRGGTFVTMPKVRKWTSKGYFSSRWDDNVALACTVAEEKGHTVIESMPLTRAERMFSNDTELGAFVESVRARTGLVAGDVRPYWNEQGEVTCGEDEVDPYGVSDDDGEDEDGAGAGHSGGGAHAQSGSMESEVAVRRRARRWVCDDLDDVPHLESIRHDHADLDVYFWMGPAGAITGTHFDVDPVGILHHVYGEKEVVLIPPGEDVGVNVGKYEPGGAAARFNPFREGTRLGPEGAVRSVSVTLRAGDMLHIPSGWWHAVRSLSPSLSFAVRTHTECTARAASLIDIPRCLHDVGLYRAHDPCTCHSDGWTKDWDHVSRFKRLFVAYLLWMGAVSDSEITPDNVHTSSLFDIVVVSISAAWGAVSRL